MKNVEISVFDPNTVEVRRREGSSMKGGRVLVGTLLSNTDKVSIFVNAPIANILGSLYLPFLVEENNGVEVGLSAIVPYPPFTRVVGILEVAGEWRGKVDRFRRGSGSGNGRLVLGKADRLVTGDTIVSHVWFGEVKDVGHKEQVLYRFEVVVSGLKGLVVKSVIA